MLTIKIAEPMADVNMKVVVVKQKVLFRLCFYPFNTIILKRAKTWGKTIVFILDVKRQRVVVKR